MTNQHPMRPKQKQLDAWREEYYDDASIFDSLFDEITTHAFQWGADCQLEQVIEWLKDELDYDPHLLLDLKEAMRPQQKKNN